MSTIHNLIVQGQLKNDDKEISVTLHYSLSDDSSSSINCTIIPDPKVAFKIDNSTTFRGTSSDGEEIWASEFNQISSTHTYKNSQTTWQCIAGIFIKGNLESLEFSDKKIICSFTIPSTPLALNNKHYTLSSDGTITINSNVKLQKEIEWNTPFGKAILKDNYTYEDSAERSKTLIRTRRYQIAFDVKKKGVFSLNTFLLEVDEYLKDIVWLVSFLSKKRINWYKAKAIVIPTKEGDEFKSIIAYKQNWLGYEQDREREKQWFELLVSEKSLRDGLFQDLVIGYEASPYRVIIQQTLPFVITSYEQGYFEAHLANIYTALETLIAGLSPEDDSDVGLLLSNQEYKKLTKKIRQLLLENIQNKDIIHSVFNKLPELKRRPILEKLLTLLDRHRVPVEMLFTAEQDSAKELKEILQRRNEFIHRGKFDDIEKYFHDLALLRNLVELWILKLLNCPDEAINKRSLRGLFQ